MKNKEYRLTSKQKKYLKRMTNRRLRRMNNIYGRNKSLYKKLCTIIVEDGKYVWVIQHQAKNIILNNKIKG